MVPKDRVRVRRRMGCRRYKHGCRRFTGCIVLGRQCLDATARYATIHLHSLSESSARFACHTRPRKCDISWPVGHCLEIIIRGTGKIADIGEWMRPVDGWKQIDCILDAISTNTIDNSDGSGIGSTIAHAEERIARREQYTVEAPLTTTSVSTTDTASIGQSAVTCTVCS